MRGEGLSWDLGLCVCLCVLTLWMRSLKFHFVNGYVPMTRRSCDRRRGARPRRMSRALVLPSRSRCSAWPPPLSRTLVSGCVQR